MLWHGGHEPEQRIAVRPTTTISRLRLSPGPRLTPAIRTSERRTSGSARMLRTSRPWVFRPMMPWKRTWRSGFRITSSLAAATPGAIRSMNRATSACSLPATTRIGCAIHGPLRTSTVHMCLRANFQVDVPNATQGAQRCLLLHQRLALDWNRNLAERRAVVAVRVLRRGGQHQFRQLSDVDEPRSRHQGSDASEVGA